MDKTNILDSIKNALGEMIDDTFNDQILSIINIAILPLSQVGCIRDLSTAIDEDTNWEDIVVIPPKSSVVNVISAATQYTYLNVKIIFDPPVSGVLDIFERKSDQLIWRLREEYGR